MDNIKSLKNKKGSSDPLLSILVAVLVISVLTVIHIVSVYYDKRDNEYAVIGNFLENTVTQICKTGMVTTDIDTELKDSLNALYTSDDYVITYKCKEVGTDSLKDIVIDSTKLYVLDTIYVQFNLNIPETGATADQLKRQPTYSRLVDKIASDNSLDAGVDLMIQMKSGVIENNAK